MRKTILLVDNNLDVLEVYGRALEGASYRVLRATTIDEARHYLATIAIDVLVADLRVVDDDSADDISGAELVEQYPDLVRVVLTGFTPANAFTLFKRLGGAILVHKGEGPQDLIEEVQRAFDERIQLNWTLDDRWIRPRSPQQLATLLDPTIDAELLRARCDEIRRLFGRLFAHCSAVVMEECLTEEPGRATLIIGARSGPLVEERYLVVIGHRATIEREMQRYAASLARFRGGVPLRVREASQLNYAAIAYRLDQDGAAPPASLRASVGQADIATLRAALENLYARTLATWWRQPLTSNDGPRLRAFLQHRANPLRRTPEQLDGALRAVCDLLSEARLATVVYTAQRIELGLGAARASYPNPLEHLLNDTWAAVGYETAWGLLYGSTNLDGVLLSQGAVCLTDLRAIEEGPLLWDFAQLETAVCLELIAESNLHSAEAVTQRLVELVEGLESAVELAGLPEPARRAVEVSLLIRHHASEWFDWGSYLLGLLVTALAELTAFPNDGRTLSRGELLRYGHALLRALCAIKRVDAAGRRRASLQAQAVQGLYVDREGAQVFVDGIALSMPPKEYHLVACLSQRPGQLVPYREIFEFVWGDRGEPNDTRLTRLVERTRETLRRVSPHNYIVNRRGYGYILAPHGDSDEP